jgi:Ca2+-binding RTX toxin-like protein
MNSALHSGFDQFDITGGSGNDRLWAWEGDDKLNGGNGNDVLTGKGGSDILTGGLGNDIFVFDSYNNGVDTITDASAGDIIRVNGRSFSGTVTSADGSAVMTDQVQLAVDTVNNKSTLFIGSDGTPGADVIITLEGIYTTEAFTLVGKDIKVTQGTTNTPGVGDDTVNGTAGNDDLSGGDGHDKLLGKAGNDVLRGDAGNDTLIGGLGADTLIGGAGNDIFQFSTLRDSTPGTLNHDVIEDFTSGADKLDLSPIDANPVLTGNQAFKFIATDFTGEAGQVRYVDGLLLADVNGDGMTDIEILLLGTPALVAGDLIL